MVLYEINLEENLERAWKCNNWYERDDGLVEIIESTGEKVLLNKNLCIVWLAIEYESSLKEIWVRTSEKMEWEVLKNIIRILYNAGLISIKKEKDIFKELFG